MSEHLQWFLAGFLVCLVAAWLALWLHRRADAKRLARRAAADAVARAAVQRMASQEAARRLARQAASVQEAARAESARMAQEQAEAAHARAAQQAAAQAARDEAARLEAQAQAFRVAAQEAARVEAQRRAAEAAVRVQALRLAALEAARVEAARADAARVAAAAVPAARPVAVSAPKTPEQTMVMVADDSKVVRVKTGRLLAQHQYRVALATDGLDAVAQMQASLPDVVIVDVEMPGMDGFELTRHVRGNPLTAHIPIIMITSADDRHREDAKRFGVNVLMGKPYAEDALIGHIRRAMNHSPTPLGVMAG